MHILVIGGNGFIGSHFVAAASDAGHRVTVVGRRNVEPAYVHRRKFDYFAGGIAALVESGFLLKSADVVCHFGSSSTPTSAEADPVREREENLTSVSALLQAMSTAGLGRLVYLSSGGAVYGKPEITPVPETYHPGPIGAYGATKLAVENLVVDKGGQFGLKSLIVRPANPYGPGQPIKSGSGVIPTFILAAQAGQTVTLFGDGNMVRDFIYVADLARFLLMAIETGASGVVNVGSGLGTSLLRLLNLIETQTGKTIARQFEPARPFDPTEIVLDISRANRLTGWHPETALPEGIMKTLAGCHD